MIDAIKTIHYVFYYRNIIVSYNDHRYLFMAIVIFWKSTDINDHHQLLIILLFANAFRRAWLTWGWLWLHYWWASFNVVKSQMTRQSHCRQRNRVAPIAHLVLLHSTWLPASIWHNSTPSPGNNSEQQILLSRVDKGRCTHKHASKIKTKTQVIAV